MNAAMATTTTEIPTTDRMALAVTGLEPESALAIRSAFDEMFASAETWAASARLINVTSIDQKREMKMARESRLALRDIRVKAEHARKRLKEDSTRKGKAIDGIKAVLDALIVPIEAHLLEQETFADRVEEARKGALKSAREEALRAYGADPAVYANLGETDEETWALTLEGARAAHEAKLEAAKVAEAVRIEAEKLAAQAREAKRQEAVKAEAARVERERAQVEENARLAKEKAEIEAQAARDREAAAEAARVVRAEADRVAAEQAAALAIERKAAAEETAKARADVERGERELAAALKERADIEAAEVEHVRAAEQRRAAAAEAEAAAERAAALAPDREKLEGVAMQLRAIALPELATDAGKAAAADVAKQIAKMSAWVSKMAVAQSARQRLPFTASRPRGGAAAGR